MADSVAAPKGRLLPWMLGPWRQLAARLDTGRVPHALLFHGPKGIGKLQFAEAFAARLLCRNPKEYACEACPACQLLHAGTHPDFIRVEPSEPGKPIAVDSVRQLIATLALHPQYDGWRAVMLTPADQLNSNAANALLKTLEEPAPRTVILLITSAPASLPPTILSRCQRFHIAGPTHEEAVDWLMQQEIADDPRVLLAAVQGSPLRALGADKTGLAEMRDDAFAAFSELLMGRGDPVAISERWFGDTLERYIDWLQSWTADLVRLQSSPSHVGLYNPDLKDRLQVLAARLHLAYLFEVWASVLQAKRAVGGPCNRQLLLEEVLIQCARLGRRRNSPD